jgi:putative glutathione S-transferase
MSTRESIRCVYTVSSQHSYFIPSQAGSASDQAVYEETIQSLFDHLDKLEDVLKNASGPFFLGNGMTELDIQLYTTIIRFDPVY